MSNNVGLTTKEGVSNGLTPLQETPVRNIGVLGFRKRGPANTPILVTSSIEDKRRFGELDGNYAAYVVRHIFSNAKPFGANVYVSRKLKGSYLAAMGQVAITPAMTATFAQTQASGASQAEILTLTLANAVSGAGVFMELPDYASPTKFTRAYITAGGTVNTDAASLKAAWDAAIAAGGYTSSWTAAVSGAVITLTRTVNNVATTAAQRIASIYGVTLASNAYIVKVEAGQLGSSDPGTWANATVRVEVYPKGHASGIPNRYLFKVYYNNEFKESFSGATWTELVGNVNAGSYYTKATLSTDSATFSTPQIFYLTLGANGDAIVEADMYPVSDPVTPTGLAVFDSQPVNFVCCPEFNTTTMNAKGKEYAETSGRRVYVSNVTYGASDVNVAAYATLLQTATPSFIAHYALWVKTSDDAGNYVWVPGQGVIIGAGIIRVPGLSNDEAHIPPAGIDSVFRDCIDIWPNLSLDQQRINLYVQQYTTNIARFSPGKGFYLASSRTMSTNPLYHSLHIRILTNKYLDMLDYNYVWISQKPLTPELRNQAVQSLTTHFQGEYAKGALENSIPFAEACQVISDSTNNPRTQDRKLLNITINWIPTECSEAVVLTMSRNDGYLTIRETN
jgi:hypothetical protein